MQEFADFLGRQSPYDRLSSADLDRIAERVEVEFFAAGSTILHPDRGVVEWVRVIRKGTVRVVDQGRVVDELVSGDSFGQVAAFAGLAPALAVVAVDDVVCYRFGDPRQFIERPESLTFGRREGLAATPVVASSRQLAVTDLLADHLRPPLLCEPGETVRRTAERMTELGVTYALVRRADELGILTDSDLRAKVATGRVGLDAPSDQVASFPARSVDIHASVGDAFVEMLQHGVSHLVVTDGDAGADVPRVVGVARVVDLSSRDVRDPLRIRAAIESADGWEGLRAAMSLLPPTLSELHRVGTPALRTAALHAAIVEAALARAVQLSEAPPSGVEVAWLLLGSLARREPLPTSDFDTALVWQASGGPPEPDSLYGYADGVISQLETAGLVRCPDGANANSPLFNLSLPDWLDRVKQWRRNPDGPSALLLSSIVADSRPVTNRGLAMQLTRGLDETSRTRHFLYLMLKESIANRPPVGFVREFVVEASGDHRGELALKKRGLRPVVAIARWVGLTLGDTSGSTVDRLRRGRADGLLTSDEADVLEGGFTDMFELLYQRDIKALRVGGESSTFVDPAELDTLTRRHLRELFRAIAKIQSRLDNTWLLRIEK